MCVGVIINLSIDRTYSLSLKSSLYILHKSRDIKQIFVSDYLI